MDGAAFWFTRRSVQTRINQIIQKATECESQRVGYRVVGLDQTAFHVRAAIIANRTSGGSVLVVSAVIVIHQLVIYRVGFEIFVAIRNVPGVFLAGFAESDARPVALVVVVVVLIRIHIVDVFAGQLDGKCAGYNGNESSL